jgi:exosortase A
MKSAREIEVELTATDKGWRQAIAAWAAVALVLLGAFYKDAAGIFHQWWSSETYGHCLLIPLILVYLVWQRKAELSKLTPRPWLPAAALLLIGGAGWLVGEIAGAAIIRHTALVGMLIVSVPLVLGLAVARGLTFVLFFSLFMIPAGDQLIPTLQTITADICIKLLEWSGVPAFIDGVFIAIPNGNFEVAEACSGVRFLIAMIAFSVLVANLCFKSWTRRIVFVASAIVLSIVANGIRAFGTIYIAHLTTPAFAAGVDHIVYGWIFFAIVMVVLMAAGWKFFDRPVDDPAFDPERLQPIPPRPASLRAVVVAAAVGVAVSVAAPIYAATVLNRAPAVRTVAVVLPDVPGWTRLPSPETGWKPHYRGVSAEAIGRYIDAGGQPVDLYIGIYDKQAEKRELVGYRQGLLPPRTDWAWARNDAPPPSGRAMQINRGNEVRENWQWFLVNGKLTGSDYTVKIETLKAKLLNGSERAATLVISARRTDALTSARDDIARFAKALGPVEAAIDAAAVEAKD